MKANSIKVDVISTYAEEHSDTDQSRYVFIYSITIRNEGDKTAQLLSRHWIITDANGHIHEVRGEGVVGEQPVIVPGCEYQYSSFSVLETTVGCMQGSYQMLAEDGTSFEATIPLFTLSVPGALN